MHQINWLTERDKDKSAAIHQLQTDVTIIKTKAAMIALGVSFATGVVIGVLGIIFGS